MITSRLKFIIFNLLGLEITWAACAYEAINDVEYLGAAVGSLYVLLHFIFTKTHFEDFWTLIIVAALGILIDSLNTYYGILGFNSDPAPLLIPIWLVVLWFVFSLMIPHSLYWFSKNYFIAALAGGLVGSLTYLLGYKIGAISLSEPLLTSFLIFFLEWSILFPIALLITSTLFRLNKKEQLN